MESSAIARYIPQKSNKRVFPGSSSSSCMEPDVIEVSPPSDDCASRSKGKGMKQKEVAYHEIIDVDMDEDRNDVVFVEGKVESNKKRKGTIGISLSPSNAGQSSSSAKKLDSSKKGKDIAITPPNGFNPGTNNFFDLDDYVSEDDFYALQSHFDNMDIPTGIEAAIPFFPDMKTKSSLNRSFSPTTKKIHPQNLSSFLPSQVNYPNMPPNNFIPNLIPPSNPSSYFSSSSNSPIGSGIFPPGVFPSITSHMPTSGWPNELLKKIPNINDVYSNMYNRNGGMFEVGPPDAINGINMLNGPIGPNGPHGPKSPNSVESSSSIANLDNEEVLKKYEGFKKFDTVVDFSDHYYANQNSANKHPPKNWAKKIQDEWRILEKDLPDTIFVRVYETRMDLLRAVIIGAEGTPYHDGLFFFDVCFPSNYPSGPPLVHYHSGGLRINPNLYDNGKVCLSLLNTWTGGQKERWLPGTSTMLQVLVSIQGLILNMKPYFNEPGYANSSGSAHGESRSLQYNENTLILSLKTMVYTMKKPPKHFEDLVIGHFRNRVRDILMACKAYTEGVQVGCLVKGGVQDVDEGSNKCSPKFKNDVASCIKILVTEFKKIGAKEAEEFIHLHKKISSLPVNAPPPTSFPHNHAFPQNPAFPFASVSKSYKHFW